MSDDIKKNFLALAHDLYSEGYHCGICRNRELWFDAWAMAMQWIADGKPYTDMMVIDAYNILAGENQ